MEAKIIPAWASLNCLKTLESWQSGHKAVHYTLL